MHHFSIQWFKSLQLLTVVFVGPNDLCAKKNPSERKKNAQRFVCFWLSHRLNWTQQHNAQKKKRETDPFSAIVWRICRFFVFKFVCRGGARRATKEWISSTDMYDVIQYTMKRVTLHELNKFQMMREKQIQFAENITHTHTHRTWMMRTMAGTQQMDDEMYMYEFESKIWANETNNEPHTQAEKKKKMVRQSTDATDSLFFHLFFPFAKAAGCVCLWLFTIDTMRHKPSDPSDVECVNYRLARNPYKNTLRFIRSVFLFFVRFLCLAVAFAVARFAVNAYILASSPGVCCHSNFITRLDLSASRSHIIPLYALFGLFVFSWYYNTRSRCALCVCVCVYSNLDVHKFINCNKQVFDARQRIATSLWFLISSACMCASVREKDSRFRMLFPHIFFSFSSSFPLSVVVLCAAPISINNNYCARLVSSTSSWNFCCETGIQSAALPAASYQIGKKKKNRTLKQKRDEKRGAWNEREKKKTQTHTRTSALLPSTNGNITRSISWFDQRKFVVVRCRS